MKKIKKSTTLVIFVVIICIIIAMVGISQLTAHTPKIVDIEDNKIEDSISLLEKIKISGTDQWISIRGKDKSNPILLYLAGGPGGSQLVETRKHLSKLEEYFVIVNWDQPGSAKSYNALNRIELTPQQYLNDGHELTQYLLKRFNKEKIFILGQSWGSVLGIWLVDRYPSDYYAYIGSGQMVSFLETEKICYKTALEIARNKKDNKIIKKLEKQGNPPYYGKGVVWKEANYLMYLSAYMVNNPQIHGPRYNTLSDVMSPEYGILDKVNYFRGLITTFNDVYQKLYTYDLREQNNKIEIPVYILHGKHDLNAPTTLVRDYFEKLEAPIKKLVWFEHSGHSPWKSENDKFVEKVLQIKNNVYLKNKAK